jgi:hypothetical protein
VPDDDDRPRDTSGAADHGWSDPAHNDPTLADGDWSHAVAPDDISGLENDIAAYRRELRTARRNELLGRLFAHRGVTSLSIIMAGLALAAALATVITLIQPDSSHKGPSALPLAHPSVQVGEPHGLFPDVSLQGPYGRSVSSRTLRPSVFALIPLHCNCVRLLNNLAGVAYSDSVPLRVVAPTVSDAEATALSGQLNRGAEVYYDKSGSLASDLDAQGVTVVLLDRDGTIFSVQKSVPASGSTTLDGLLEEMLSPAARASG